MKRLVPMFDNSGARYSIPEDRVDEFRADMGEVAEARRYRDKDGKHYTIPQDQDEAFRADMPDAVPVRSYTMADGTRRDFTMSEMSKFLRSKEYRESEDYTPPQMGSPTFAGVKGALAGAAEGAYYGGKNAVAKVVTALPEAAASVGEAVGNAINLGGNAKNAVGDWLRASGQMTKRWLGENIRGDKYDEDGNLVMSGLTKDLGYEDTLTKIGETAGDAAAMAVKFAPAAVAGPAYMETILASDGINAFADTFDRVKAAGYSDAQANLAGTAAGLINYYGAKLMMKGGAATKDIANPLLRALAGTAFTGAATGAQAVGNKGVENAIEGKPITEGMLGAAGEGFVEGAQFHLINEVGTNARPAMNIRRETREMREMRKQNLLTAIETPEGRAFVDGIVKNEGVDAAIRARKEGKDVSRRMGAAADLPDNMSAAERNAVIDGISKAREARAERVRTKMDYVQAQSLADEIGQNLMGGASDPMFEDIWLNATRRVKDATELDEPGARARIVGEAIEDVVGKQLDAGPAKREVKSYEEKFAENRLLRTPTRVGEKEIAEDQEARAMGRRIEAEGEAQRKAAAEKAQADYDEKMAAYEEARAKRAAEKKRGVAKEKLTPLPEKPTPPELRVEEQKKPVIEADLGEGTKKSDLSKKTAQVGKGTGENAEIGATKEGKTDKRDISHSSHLDIYTPGDAPGGVEGARIVKSVSGKTGEKKFQIVLKNGESIDVGPVGKNGKFGIRKGDDIRGPFDTLGNAVRKANELYGGEKKPAKVPDGRGRMVEKKIETAKDTLESLKRIASDENVLPKVSDEKLIETLNDERAKDPKYADMIGKVKDELEKRGKLPQPSKTLENAPSRAPQETQPMSQADGAKPVEASAKPKELPTDNMGVPVGNVGDSIELENGMTAELVTRKNGSKKWKITRGKRWTTDGGKTWHDGLKPGDRFKDDEYDTDKVPANAYFGNQKSESGIWEVDYVRRDGSYELKPVPMSDENAPVSAPREMKPTSQADGAKPVEAQGVENKATQRLSITKSGKITAKFGKKLTESDISAVENAAKSLGFETIRGEDGSIKVENSDGKFNWKLTDEQSIKLLDAVNPKTKAQLKAEEEAKASEERKATAQNERKAFLDSHPKEAEIANKMGFANDLQRKAVVDAMLDTPTERDWERNLSIQSTKAIKFLKDNGVNTEGIDSPKKLRDALREFVGKSPRVPDGKGRMVTKTNGNGVYEKIANAEPPIGLHPKFKKQNAAEMAKIGVLAKDGKLPVAIEGFDGGASKPNYVEFKYADGSSQKVYGDINSIKKWADGVGLKPSVSPAPTAKAGGDPKTKNSIVDADTARTDENWGFRKATNAIEFQEQMDALEKYENHLSLELPEPPINPKTKRPYGKNTPQYKEWAEKRRAADEEYKREVDRVKKLIGEESEDWGTASEARAQEIVDKAVKFDKKKLSRRDELEYDNTKIELENAFDEIPLEELRELTDGYGNISRNGIGELSESQTRLLDAIEAVNRFHEQASKYQRLNRDKDGRPIFQISEATPAQKLADPDFKAWARKQGRTPTDGARRIYDAQRVDAVFKVAKNWLKGVKMRRSENAAEVPNGARMSIGEVDDTAYVDAVKRGDMATAARMVSEVAAKAMPDIMRDENGKPLVVYHSTDADFTKFDRARLGENTDLNASDEAARRMARLGFWFNEKDLREKLYQNRVIAAYTNVKKPYETTFDELWDVLSETSHKKFVDGLKKDGYDGIVLEDSELGGKSFVLFDPKQIKSADPVTYDNSGKVIPLSQRFNPRSNDIRYLYSRDGNVVGWYDRAKKEVVTLPGADAATVAHELGWHATYDYAQAEAAQGRTALLDKLNDYAANAPQPVKNEILRKYGMATDTDVLLDEIGAARYTMDNVNKIKDAATRRQTAKWYQRTWNAIADTYKAMLSKLGWNKARLDNLSALTPEETVNLLADEMLKGRNLGNAKSTQIDMSKGESIAQLHDRKLKDRLRPIEEIENDAGKSVGNSAYILFRTLPGKVQKAINEAKAFEKKVKDECQKAGIKTDEINELLYASAAPERNGKVLSRNGRLNGSAMSHADIQRILSAYRNSPKYAAMRRIADMALALQKKGFDFRRDAGLISYDTWHTLSTEEPNHVPMKSRFDPNGEHMGFSLTEQFGKPEWKTAEGRTNVGDGPLEWIVQEYVDAFSRGHENVARRALLETVLAHPEVGEVKKLGPNDALGEVKRKGQQGDPNVFVVKTDGDTYQVKLNGTRGELIARAVSGRGLVRAPQSLQKAMRWWSSAATSWSPTFAVRNFLADTIDVFAVNIGEKGLVKGLGASGKHVKTALKLTNAIRKYASTGETTDPLIREAVDAGVLMGGGVRGQAFADAGEEALKTLKTDWRNGKNRIKAVRNFMFGWIDTLNQTAELMNRMADYKLQMESLSKANNALPQNRRRSLAELRNEAALHAREITVDFNQKGELTPVTNMLYMFSNSTLGATMRLNKAIFASKEGKSLAAGTFAIGLIEGTVEAMANGDDEDGKNMNEYTRANSFYFRKGKDIYRIPLHASPISVIKYAGNCTARKLFGTLKGDKAAEQIAKDMIGMMTSYLGIGALGDNEAASIAPTIVQPFLQAYMNRDFADRPIERTSFSEEKPKSGNGRPSTPQFYHDLAKWLNEFGGGNAGRKGEFLGVGTDFSPEMLKHFSEATGKNALRDIENTVEFAKMVLGKTEWDRRNIPVGRDYFRTTGGNDNRFFEAVRAYKTDASDFKERTGADRKKFEDSHPWLKEGRDGRTTVNRLINMTNRDKPRDGVEDMGITQLRKLTEGKIRRNDGTYFKPNTPVSDELKERAKEWLQKRQARVIEIMGK